MTDLETDLRNTLRERATDIDTVPVDFAHLASLDVLDHDQAHHLNRGRRTAWLIAASVVAVLAVAATVIGLGKMRSDHHVAPGTEHPSPPHASASPALVQRSTCTATLPNTWRTALISGTSRFGAVSTMPLAVSPDGSAMLVARDYGSRRDVALVRG
ncbi:MAG: hypothetical protein QOC66_3324, partial [Pseudonocardiales bacterium]|nr:hypothetical protein [Pseudonocardiales bacterium]